jgi:hypothetical protein
MRAVLALFVVVSCLACAHRTPKCVDAVFNDPLSTDASTVDSLHREHLLAVCRVGADRPEAMLQLCRDKGFDAVSIAPEVVSVELLKRAEQLNLPVLTAPSTAPGR